MRSFQASTWREGDLFVAQCLEVDVASQGSSVQEALTNLREALELFFETASPAEIAIRLRESVRIANVEVQVG